MKNELNLTDDNVKFLPERELMSENQKLAFDMFLNSASFETDFKPLSEEALSERLKDKGVSVSSSTINRWKTKFQWSKALENKITLAMSDNSNVKNLIAKSSLEAAVKNTKVDIERNDILVAGCYEVAETELNRILNISREKGSISKEDFKRFEFLMTMATGRRDKMIDRLALMPREALSPEDVLERLNKTTLDIEDDFIEAEEVNDDTQNNF